MSDEVIRERLRQIMSQLEGTGKTIFDFLPKRDCLECAKLVACPDCRITVMRIEREGVPMVEANLWQRGGAIVAAAYRDRGDAVCWL